MATHYSDQYRKAISGAGPAGDLKVLFGSITFATAPLINDVVKMFTMPKGFTPLFGWMQGDDIDSGTEALELDIGIAGATTKYLDSGVLTGDTLAPDDKITVGIRVPLQGDLMLVKPTAFTEDTDLIVTVTAAAHGGGTGTVTVWMAGVYNDGRVV